MAGKTLIRALAFFFFSFLRAAETFSFGPVAPTDAILSKTKGINKTIPDLPYKPQNPEGDPGTFPVSDNDASAKAPEEKIDWSKIPFVPSKKIELEPAPDPEIE